ncbi:hypothetical protein KKG22_03625 [Patescibacteria group bacterium]|nr:hypothetical protein [Patescibacteria group bacterium]MBU1721239.1 hypothetical protein [Patescibacteria group bacterium]MBU1901053.1 hypothetical protein [Patescibacteria group bacterium]
MIDIPLYMFLFLYFLFLAVISVFLLINLYHIIVSGSMTLTSFFLTFLIFGGLGFTLYMTLQLTAQVHWGNTLTVFDPAWISNIFTPSNF